jgi:DNA-binding NarL/FixJ family response regulator
MDGRWLPGEPYPTGAGSGRAGDAEASGTLRILVVAEDTLARAGLAALIGSQAGFVMAGQIAASEDVAGALAIYRPDVTLWDLGWVNEDSLAHLSDLAQPDPSGLFTPVVALAPDIDRAAQAWSAGVRAIVLRTASAAALTAALVAAAYALWIVDPDLAPALFLRREIADPPLEPLTMREREVLQLLAEGAANKTIARSLQISEHTVKFHVNSIMSKLGVQSRTEAVVRATRAGLILL